MLEYTVTNNSIECLAPLSAALCSLFFSFPLKNVVYDITEFIVHVHKNSFSLCVGGNHSELEANKGYFDRKT